MSSPGLTFSGRVLPSRSPPQGPADIVILSTESVPFMKNL
jgi:hypothetical protein